MASASTVQQKSPDLKLFFEVFNNPKLGGLPSLICTYLTSEEFYAIFQAVHKFSHFNFPKKGHVNWKEPGILEKHLASHLKTAEHISSASRIAMRTYEAPLRPVTNDLGIAFPMNPEVLSYLMNIAYGKRIVEFGAASGEDSILLAYAGAKEVYVNDLNAEEMASFEHLLTSLPKDVSQRLEKVEGDALDFLKKKPKLAQKIDLVVCRNLIHLFTKQQQEEFFTLLQQILKPGGYALFIVSSVYAKDTPMFEEYFKKNPELSCFRIARCCVIDHDRGLMPVKVIFTTINKVEEAEALPLKAEKIELYGKNRDTQGNWRSLPSLKTLSKSLQKEVSHAYDTHQESLSPIKSGTIKLITSDVRLYSEHTLFQLMHKHRFKPEFFFGIEKAGHLVESEELHHEAVFIGMLVQWNPKEGL